MPGCSSKPKVPDDGTSSLIGLGQQEIKSCISQTPRVAKKHGYELWGYGKSMAGKTRSVASESDCKTAIKFVDGKVERVFLFPKGTTLTNRHPACEKMYSLCVREKTKGSKLGESFGSGFMRGLYNGLKRATENESDPY